MKTMKDRAISLNAVKETFKKWQPYMATRLHDFERELFELPSVTPQRPMGHWDKSCRCSECGEWNILESEKLSGKYKFCPNCGADMRERSEE